MNREKVIFAFFIILALTLNFGFFIGDIDNAAHHNSYELFAAIVVNLIATVLKFGDRTHLGAVLLATSLVADLQLIAAAIVWGVTALTGYQIGWMAVGVGFLVGFSVRRFGQGVDTVFGVSGAAISLLACLAGNLLAVCILIGRQESIPILDLVTRLDLNAAVEITKATFNPIDLLFYGIAVYEGYKFSFRRISQEEMERLASG